MRATLLTILIAVAAVALLSAPVASAGVRPWPDGLTGPFELDRYERLRIAATDGVILDGVVALPKLPRGVRVPVVLQISPYHATLDPAGDEPEGDLTHVPPRERLIREGYAVAYVNVRGTGASGGCFDFLGAAEQRDSVTIVEDLAARPWSNGRVATIGVSYDAGTAFQPAVRCAKGLKAVVASGLVTDLYGALFSPQGAAMDDQWPGVAGFYGAVSNAPRRGPAEQQPQLLLDQAAVKAICPDVARWMTQMSAVLLPERDAQFFAERDLLSQFGRIRAAVLVAHGFRDHVSFSEDTVFAALRKAHRHQLLGQWTHGFPDLPDWNDRLVGFLDPFLKGRGDKPREGVEFFDTTGDRHLDRAWPPSAAREQALPLSTGGFRTLPDTSAAENSVSPHEDPVTLQPAKAPYAPHPPCRELQGVTALTYTTPAVTEHTLVAGNPRALVHLASDRTSGAFVLRLFRLRPGFDCLETATFDYLGSGAADLRHHRGNLAPQPFPIGSTQPVRVDVQNLAVALEPGDRVAAALQFGPFKTNAYGAGTTITVGGGEIAIPVLEGSLRLERPRGIYPSRPRSGL